MQRFVTYKGDGQQERVVPGLHKWLVPGLDCAASSRHFGGRIRPRIRSNKADACTRQNPTPNAHEIFRAISPIHVGSWDVNAWLRVVAKERGLSERTRQTNERCFALAA
jgi:hypothetical protein